MKKIGLGLAVVFLLQYCLRAGEAETLQVYVAVNQPTSSLAFPNATRVGFTRVFLHNPSSVPVKAKLRVQKTGVADDWVFRSVVLLDDNYNQIGIPAVLDAQHQAVIGDSLEILPGYSKPVIVAGNMNSDLSFAAGQYVRLDVVGVETDAVVDAPQIPITDGTAHLINASFVLGTATAYLSVFDPMVPQTRKAGTTGYRFSGVRVIAGSGERIRLRSVVFTQRISPQHGLTPANISNVEVVIDGVHYPTEVRRNIDVVHYPLPVLGDRYTAQFGQGVVVDKGFSKDIYIQGDLDDSTETRLLDMDIISDLDLYATGETYGYGIPVYAGSVSIGIGQNSKFPQGYPWFSGSLLTVEANIAPSNGGGGVSVGQGSGGVGGGGGGPPIPQSPPVVVKELPFAGQQQLLYILESEGTVRKAMWCIAFLENPAPVGFNRILWDTQSSKSYHDGESLFQNTDGTAVGFRLPVKFTGADKNSLLGLGARIRFFRMSRP